MENNNKNRKNNTYNKGKIIGLFFCLLGIFLIILKGLTVEYIDEYGILRENFFLIPIGYLLILIGIILFIISKIKNKK